MATFAVVVRDMHGALEQIVFSQNVELKHVATTAFAAGYLLIEGPHKKGNDQIKGNEVIPWHQIVAIQQQA